MKHDQALTSLNKESMEHVIESMKPEKNKEEKEATPEAKIEIELMLNTAKKKKKE